MEFGCPVCNGLTDLKMFCPKCSEQMEDDGSLDNFLGPYSPYEEHDLYHMLGDGQQTERCIHLVHCLRCGGDFRVGIQRIMM